MSKFAYQPLTVLVRAEPSDFLWISTSAKVLRAAANFATMISLLGAAAVCLTGRNAFTPGTFGPKGTAGVSVFPAATVSATTSADQGNGIGLLLPDKNQAHQGAIASAHSTVDQTSTPALNPTPPTASVASPESKASANDSALVERERPEAVRKNLERELPKLARKSLEKERRETKHKRYRREMNARRGPKNESGF